MNLADECSIESYRTSVDNVHTMFRDLDILMIAGKFWVMPRARAVVKVPFDDGKFYRVFDRIEDAVAFRKAQS